MLYEFLKKREKEASGWTNGEQKGTQVAQVSLVQSLSEQGQCVAWASLSHQRDFPPGLNFTMPKVRC